MKLGKIFICINIYYRFDEYNRTISYDRIGGAAI